MQTEARGARDWRALVRYAPSLVAAVTVTELFYKFKSFTLEFVGFALTFAVLYWSQQALARAFSRR